MSCAYVAVEEADDSAAQGLLSRQRSAGERQERGLAQTHHGPRRQMISTSDRRDRAANVVGSSHHVERSSFGAWESLELICSSCERASPYLCFLRFLCVFRHSLSENLRISQPSVCSRARLRMRRHAHRATARAALHRAPVRVRTRRLNGDRTTSNSTSGDRELYARGVHVRRRSPTSLGEPRVNHARVGNPFLPT